jgi:tetraacyldisaccharide 4'-kinase
MLNAPSFWFNGFSWQALLLSPFSLLYRLGLALRWALTRPTKVSVPVICVGNVLVGGSGKTPVVAHIARRLLARGVRVHIVSRGYGGRARGPLRVDPSRHTSAEVGDEPLLLAQTAPVWIARNKIAGAVTAILGGAECILLDDGLQNPLLYKNLSFLVLDDRRHNGQLLPAGPLREPLSSAIACSSAIIWLGKGDMPPTKAKPRPVLKASAVTTATAELSGKKLYAFCGIANPQKFFDGLLAQGALLAGSRSFPDHHAFSETEITAVLDQAEKSGAVAATTAKDAARLAPEQRAKMLVCDVALNFEDEAALDEILGQLFRE